MNIKDYIHYYIGQSFQFDNKQWEMIAVSRKLVTGWRDNTEISSTEIQVYHNEAKLMLRRLSDMTEEEATELAKIQTVEKRLKDVQVLLIEKDRVHYIDGSMWQGDGVEEYNDLYVYYDLLTPKQFVYLLKQGFDLFGLLDAGLAIDAKTIQPPK